jgi:S1-C subfamily serine protease
VVGVLCGTGAATAGITAGDVITTADGHQVQSPDALTAIVARCPPGAVVPVSWVSTAGMSRTSRIRLGPAPAT